MRTPAELSRELNATAANLERLLHRGATSFQNDEFYKTLYQTEDDFFNLKIEICKTQISEFQNAIDRHRAALVERQKRRTPGGYQNNQDYKNLL